ncbi:MAG: hypothetical protein AAF333_05195 [Planctomycetota bacterium]
MKPIHHTLLSVGAVGLLAASAQATTFGYDAPEGFWDRGEANTAFALFDTFDATTGSVGAATDAGGFSATDLTQDSTFVSGFVPPDGFNPAGIFGDGDRIYLHDNSIDFNLTASAGFDAKTVIAQVKQFQLDDFSFNPPTLNGFAADFSQTVGLDEGGTDVSITTFAWFDALDGTLISDLSLNLTANPFTFASIDGIQIDASDTFFVVPEPAGAALLAGLVPMTLRRRRAS